MTTEQRLADALHRLHVIESAVRTTREDLEAATPEKPAPDLGWSQPIDRMCDMDVARAARLIGMDVVTFRRGRYHIAAWGTRGGDLSAEGPPLEYIDALRLALTNAASDACRFDWPSGRVWLGPLPMPTAEPEKEPAAPKPVTCTCGRCSYDAERDHWYVTRDGRYGTQERMAFCQQCGCLLGKSVALDRPEPAAPKPVTCACGRCEWSPKRLCWIITGSCATIPVGVFCEVCGSYLASGVATDQQAAMRWVREAYRASRTYGLSDATLADALAALPIREVADGE